MNPQKWLLCIQGIRPNEYLLNVSQYLLQLSCYIQTYEVEVQTIPVVNFVVFRREIELKSFYSPILIPSPPQLPFVFIIILKTLITTNFNSNSYHLLCVRHCSV